MQHAMSARIAIAAMLHCALNSHHNYKRMSAVVCLIGTLRNPTNNICADRNRGAIKKSTVHKVKRSGMPIAKGGTKCSLR